MKYDKQIIEVLQEAKEALLNVNPDVKERACFDSGHFPCQCTLCKINRLLSKNEKHEKN